MYMASKFLALYGDHFLRISHNASTNVSESNLGMKNEILGNSHQIPDLTFTISDIAHKMIVSRSKSTEKEESLLQDLSWAALYGSDIYLAYNI